MDKKKIGIIVGTRPEMIKMAPVYQVLGENPSFEIILVHTGQHQSLFEEASIGFRITPNITIRRKAEKGNLNIYLSELISDLEKVYDDNSFDFILVHGDTLTSYASAICAFHRQIPVGHVEAGLRTYDKTAPFPEELYRQMIDRICDFHFAPTASAKECLLQENIIPNQIHITGNTIVDALKDILERMNDFRFTEDLERLLSTIKVEDKTVALLTLHRREIQGDVMAQILGALKSFAERHQVHFICPVHPNPAVKNNFESILQNHASFSLIKPLSYPLFVKLMKASDIIISDSGGIQEEAPVIAKPVFVLRDVTERGEGLVSGHAVLCGTEPQKIVQTLDDFMNNKIEFGSQESPYGDGQASKRIALVVSKFLLG